MILAKLMSIGLPTECKQAQRW